MDRRKGILERLTEGTDLPAEAIPNQTVVEVVGDSRVLIEHHSGVTEYGREKICVRVRYGKVEICGCGLELARMTKDQLVITGRIQGVMLHRRGK